MLQTHRRTPQFDSLEGRIFLSSGMADPAPSIHRTVAKRFLLDGALSGLPNGSTDPNGFTVSSFSVVGHLTSMGRVDGIFLLQDTFVPIGKLPDLSNSLLILTNDKGSILVAMYPSRANPYHFQIVGVTRSYVSASGSGWVVISPGRGSLDLILRFRSSRA